MKFNEKYKVNPEFADLFNSGTTNDSIEINAKNISNRFISEIEKLCDERGLLRKDLAKDLGTSASYITQLFRGDKLLNLNFISKIEDYFKITFDIHAKSIADNLLLEDIDKFNKIQLSNLERRNFAWVLMKYYPNCNKIASNIDDQNNSKEKTNAYPPIAA
jgi:transcriptional regulator with XRE-family HTH domain